MQPITKEKIFKLWEENSGSKDFNTLYADIPFCSQSCLYCKYRKNYRYSPNNVDGYLDTLEKEMEYFSPLFKDKYISALFIGGGSPSVLNPKQIGRFNNMVTSLFNINVEENGTRTIELNPADLTVEKIKEIFSSGLYNRASMGIQSLSQDVLGKNRRMFIDVDTLKRIVEAIRYFNHDTNINIDLMVGIEGETEETIIDSFNQLNSVDLNLVTLYINTSIKRDEQLLAKINNVLGGIDHSRYEMHGIDNDKDVLVKNAYLFFNKSNMKLYDYMYSLGPPIANCVGFGPLAQSHINNINFFYNRDDAIDFSKSQYVYEYRVESELGRENLKIYQRGDKYIY